jgi:hypothetical protein
MHARSALSVFLLFTACGGASPDPKGSKQDLGPPAQDPNDGSVAPNNADAGPTPDGAPATGRWLPAKDTSFYWDLTNTPPDNTVNVGAYDIDGFGNTAAEVTALHALGKKVVCYMDAGTFEPGRPDSAQFPAALQGSAVQGWPGEKWLDIRPSGPSYATLQAIMKARFQICHDKGFDAVEPDNIDSYENDAGFNATASDQLSYDEWIATTVHGLGMAVFQKNDVDQTAQLVSDFDGILDEECNKFSECDTLQPYLNAGKAVWDAEYTDDGESTAAFCATDVSAGIVGALFSLALDGKTFEPCTNDVGLVN